MMPRKRRHTAKRVFGRLVAEHGFDGSYSGLRRYVKAWCEANRAHSDGYLRLRWDPGAVQVDFGVAVEDLAGVERTVRFLVATMPYSNMRFAVAMPGENAECLCAGLSMVYERMGGVPSVMVMDDVTDAGRRVGNGDVTPAACSPRSSRATACRCACATRTQATRRATWRTPSATCDAISWSPSRTSNPSDSSRACCWNDTRRWRRRP